MSDLNDFLTGTRRPGQIYGSGSGLHTVANDLIETKLRWEDCVDSAEDTQPCHQCVAQYNMYAGQQGQKKYVKIFFKLKISGHSHKT